MKLTAIIIILNSWFNVIEWFQYNLAIVFSWFKAVCSRIVFQREQLHNIIYIYTNTDRKINCFKLRYAVVSQAQNKIRNVTVMEEKLTQNTLPNLNQQSFFDKILC